MLPTDYVHLIFTLPESKLREEFRTRFLDGLQQAYDRGALVLTGRHGQLFAPPLPSPRAGGAGGLSAADRGSVLKPIPEVENCDLTAADVIRRADPPPTT